MNNRNNDTKPPRYTTLLWDQDGTLMDFVYAQKKALTECFVREGRHISEEWIERYARINEAWWKRYELGEAARDELSTGRFRQLFAEMGLEGIDVEQFLRNYQEGLGSYYEYLDDSLTICKQLQGQVKQYVVTNGMTFSQRRKLTLSGFMDVMDGVFISEEMGTRKPFAEYFEYCFARIEEQDKQRILIIGDSLSSDIRGGSNAGIATCYYNPKGLPQEEMKDSVCQPDYEIRDLHEIFGILGLTDKDR